MTYIVSTEDGRSGKTRFAPTHSFATTSRLSHAQSGSARVSVQLSPSRSAAVDGYDQAVTMRVWSLGTSAIRTPAVPSPRTMRRPPPSSDHSMAARSSHSGGASLASEMPPHPAKVPASQTIPKETLIYGT